MFAKRLPVVLLVEDSPHDVEIARRAIAKSGVACRLVVAEQGDQALGLMAPVDCQRERATAFRPALIRLDLNSPGATGRELLRLLKTDPALCSIPVVVLTTSPHQGDIDRCYQAQANSYHAKSDNLADYQKMMRQIVEYWLGAAVLCSAAEPVGAEH